MLEVSVVLQSSSRRSPGPKIPLDERFEDEARFLKTWLEKPLLTGAVTPSGKMLARTRPWPPQVGQVFGFEPALAPEPEQTSQVVAVGILRLTVSPL